MREALKLALEALEDRSSLMKWQEARDAVKEALAQPEQKPVAWRAPNWGHGDDEWVYRDFDDPVLIAHGRPSPNNEPLYTTPPQRTWVGLTDEERKAIRAKATEYTDITDWNYTKRVQEATELALQEKNK